MVKRPKKPREKPVLYIDVDGVLFAHYGDPFAFQLRPGVGSFLTWAIRNFRCRFLTCWSEDQVWKLLHSIYLGGYVPQGQPGPTFEYANWKPTGQKSGVVKRHETFFWIEDGVSREDEALLKSWGKWNCYIPVNPSGEDGLAEAKKALERRLTDRKFKIIEEDKPPLF